MSTRKPGDLEDEYFHRLDEEAKKALREKLEREAEERARAEARELHAGHCGRCGGTFEVRSFRGVDIDVCTWCGSVLLDPGELEQLAGEDASEKGVVHFLKDLFLVTRR